MNEKKGCGIIALLAIICAVLLLPQTAGAIIPAEEWSKAYGAYYSRAYSAQQTSDGGYAFAGYTYTDGSRAWLVKTNSNGIEQWNRTFGSGNDWKDVRSMEQTSDGGYILAGYKAGVYPASAWLIKTDSNGVEQWNRIFEWYGHGYWAESVKQTSDGGYIIGAGYKLIKTDSNGLI